MTRPPDFDELVGTDLPERERERLLRVHELLVAAGPPPELAVDASAVPGEAPAAANVVPLRPRRVLRVAAIAAALGILVFALGFIAGDQANEYGTFEVISLTGAGTAQGASGRIEVFDRDDAGNWPMEIGVTGLEPPAEGHLYELWLTRGGEPVALCGSFLADADGTTVVPMNAPWRLDEFDGWVVVEDGSKEPLLTT